MVQTLLIGVNTLLDDFVGFWLVCRDVMLLIRFVDARVICLASLFEWGSHLIYLFLYLFELIPFLLEFQLLLLEDFIAFCLLLPLPFD